MSHALRALCFTSLFFSASNSLYLHSVSQGTHSPPSCRLLPYGVLAGGLLSAKYLNVPASEVTLNTVSLRKYAQVLGQNGDWDW